MSRYFAGACGIVCFRILGGRIRNGGDTESIRLCRVRCFVGDDNAATEPSNYGSAPYWGEQLFVVRTPQHSEASIMLVTNDSGGEISIGSSALDLERIVAKKGAHDCNVTIRAGNGAYVGVLRLEVEHYALTAVHTDDGGKVSRKVSANMKLSVFEGGDPGVVEDSMVEPEPSRAVPAAGVDLAVLREHLHGLLLVNVADAEGQDESELASDLYCEVAVPGANAVSRVGESLVHTQWTQTMRISVPKRSEEAPETITVQCIDKYAAYDDCVVAEAKIPLSHLILHESESVDIVARGSRGITVRFQCCFVGMRLPVKVLRGERCVYIGPSHSDIAHGTRVSVEAVKNRFALVSYQTVEDWTLRIRVAVAHLAPLRLFAVGRDAQHFLDDDTSVPLPPMDTVPTQQTQSEGKSAAETHMVKPVWR